MGNKGFRIYQDGELITVIVKDMNRIIFKKTCPLNNKKQVRNMMKLLEHKGFIDLGKKDKGWF